MRVWGDYVVMWINRGFTQQYKDNELPELIGMLRYAFHNKARA